ncbi:MAG TPA: hypothetical protein EYP69_02840, partial [Bacteroidales bacterium]|nr:hypothetical protein [Bacteroidales bacterium]
MIISKKQLIPFDKGAEKCWFLLIMSFFTSFLLAVLNIYIGYLVIQSFLGDSWSFLGGAFIGTSYVVTIPALVLSIFSVRWIRLDISRKYIFPISISIIGILVGLILQNATELWIYIIIFSIFLLISCFTCTKNKKRDNSGDKATDDSIINDNPALNSDKQLLQKSINSGDNKTFKIVKAFQIVGLVLLFILTLSLIGAVSMPKQIDAVNHQFVFYGFIFSFSILILHSIVTIAFFKKKKWALIFKEVESYTLSGLILLLFISFILTEGITLTKNSFITLFIFVFLFLIYGYLIKSYRK